MINTKTKLNMVIGSPINHSLSPLIHNELYKIYNLDSDYVFLAREIKKVDLELFVASLKVLGVNGLSVTLPHKSSIIDYIDDVDSTAMIIGSVNTVINQDGVLKGYNTDWLGTLLPLADHYGVYVDNVNKIPRFLEGKKVAVFGAGGVSRAMCYAVLMAGCELYIINRTLDNAIIIKDSFEELIPGSVIKAFDTTHCNVAFDCEVVINSTSIGMVPEIEYSPVESNFIHSSHILFDAVYTPKITKFLQYGLDKNCSIITGDNMFFYQAMYQFQLQTGVLPTLETVKSILTK